jgi:hypothetical protein
MFCPICRMSIWAADIDAVTGVFFVFMGDPAADSARRIKVGRVSDTVLGRSSVANSRTQAGSVSRLLTLANPYVVFHCLVNGWMIEKR